jgi:hypothetical protein
MKILAATPESYSRTTYIAEIKSDELSAILALSQYGKIPIVRDGKKEDADRDQLKAGDLVDRDSTLAAGDNIQSFLTSRDEIEKAMSSLKGVMTKLQNSLPAKK